MSFFKSSDDINEKEGCPYRSFSLISDLITLAKTARECNLANVNRTVDKSKLSVKVVEKQWTGTGQFHGLESGLVVGI